MASQNNEESELDEYQKVLASLSEDVIVTFNNSDPTQSGTDELTVTWVSDNGEVGLKGRDGSHWVVEPDSRTEQLALFEADGEWSQKYETITTIEVVGIDG